MRFLLISDTHGDLGVINDLAGRAQADTVIHAGDFGFYDDGSYGRLSDRELRLQIAHSNLSGADKERILELPRERKIQVARERGTLGEFPRYITGLTRFDVPVYAVWGNHEDKDVIERLFRGDIAIENLHILHHRRAYRVGPALVYGLGGNFLASSKLMDRPIAGEAGKIWSTLSQYADLVETVEKAGDGSELRIFVSHVSPGKEPFVELIGARTRSDFTVSGHMGAPTCMVWNPFAISSIEEATNRLFEGLEAVRKPCINAAKTDAMRVDETLSFIGRIREDTAHVGRGFKAPRWYRGMTHVNLSDAHVGYAVLDGNETGVKLQTFSVQ